MVKKEAKITRLCHQLTVTPYLRISVQGKMRRREMDVAPETREIGGRFTLTRNMALTFYFAKLLLELEIFI